MNAWHAQTDFVGLEYLTRVKEAMKIHNPLPSYVAYNREWVWLIGDSLHPSGCKTIQYPISDLVDCNKCFAIIMKAIYGRLYDTLCMVQDVVCDLSFLALHVASHPSHFAAHEGFEPREQLWPEDDINDEEFQDQWRACHGG